MASSAESKVRSRRRCSKSEKAIFCLSIGCVYCIIQCLFLEWMLKFGCLNKQLKQKEFRIDPALRM